MVHLRICAEIRGETAPKTVIFAHLRVFSRISRKFRTFFVPNLRKRVQHLREHVQRLRDMHENPQTSAKITMFGRFLRRISAQTRRHMAIFPTRAGRSTNIRLSDLQSIYKTTYKSRKPNYAARKSTYKSYLAYQATLDL